MKTQPVTRSVLRYFGGKFALADWIIPHFTPHQVYTEVFGGGGSVLMKKPRAKSEVYNDLNSLVVNVFRVLRDAQKAQQLAHLISLTPYSREELLQVAYTRPILEVEDEVERARLTIFRSIAAFGGTTLNSADACGFRTPAKDGECVPAMRWRDYPHYIKAFCERLRGVTIEHLDYREVLKKYDTSYTLHYIDPPYVHQTRNAENISCRYEYEFTDQDHIELHDHIRSLKGNVILSGYDSELYRRMYADFHRVENLVANSGFGPRTEVLWLKQTNQITLF